MKYWVGTYARIVCKQKEHPWKWLTKNLYQFWNNKKIRKNDDKEGFESVKEELFSQEWRQYGLEIHSSENFE